MTKLWIVSIIIELFSAIMVFFLGLDFIDIDPETKNIRWALLLGGVGFFAYIYTKYRNADKRHRHETETKYEVKNLQKRDEFKEHRYRLRESAIRGENSTDVAGDLRSNI